MTTLLLIGLISATQPSGADSAVVDAELEQQKKWVAEAMTSLATARQAALELRTDDALRAFDDAQNLFGRGIAALDDFQPMARGLLEMGAAYLDAGRKDKATYAFRRALALGTGVRPDPKVFNPEVVRRYAAVEKEIARAPRGSMTIVSKPEAAEVLVDGRPIGLTPISLNDLVVGEHWIVVRLAGFHRFSTRITVGNERLDRTEVFLRPLPGAQAVAVAKPAADKATSNNDPAKDAVAKPSADKTKPAGDAPERIAPQRVEPVTPTLTETPERAAARGVHPGLAWLPLGIPQFMEKRPGWGAFFLTSQVLLLAANLTAFALVQTDRDPNNPGTFYNPGRSEALKWTANISFGLLAVDVIAGAIDGIVHRNAAVSAD